MTGAGAAMQRVFVTREQHALGPGQEDLLAGLAARVRELIEAVVLTDVELAEVAEVAGEVAKLTARLSAVGRVAPPIAQLDGQGLVRQLASPVSGRLNPIAPPVEMRAQPDGSVRCDFTLSAVYEG